ncbi:MAG: uroporphyrinogen-III C-methyltransferase [Erysipelotrichia bacterium]|uniref:uroporphyrinogen-III C-methyltransferase n=1 Tax=Arcobacter aquimarinus TaxID=1315211 RepID=A0AAE7B0J0_9BACT|nr:uroporphyrinogen-III C-methyltransferase [Arcobacter aquimarinus]MCB9096364.1 uroporphyrinogen-III C-methyltransferase [Arcobacter sp.]NCB13919.1 uroporphyrinogen-III C-methyltransferase [Erysipelotrichia bacterium]QKE25188.1 uroporphyrinogen-III (C7)-methyltransferase [Arcobacter aquimarinus]RXI36364.1 uroporphyrinogen-III C-methyltransferase [Arcobacter aquimarinus]
MSKVYLTGAGPGDIELLTLKALRVIQNADVLIYDRLVNPEILEMVKKDCDLIYVGKEDKKHTLPQDEINELIYQATLKYENVVRLKGGDPFVFGRGGEEALYLQQRDIKFEIIPGISSAIAVPAYAGIPVTHRGITTSFRVVTGHENPKKKISQIEWKTFLNDETIVFLMGYHNLEIITSKLISLGKSENYPCAVISKGTTKDQEVVVSTLKNIVEDSKNLPTPVMIIIGEVVNLRENIKWFN